MKAIVIALYECLSEGINCSLTKQQRQSVSRKIQLSLNETLQTALVLGTGCSSGSLLNTWANGLLRGM
jgi:hypothetical protein